jgi:hypothetical protein
LTRLQKYLARGGAIIASFASGMDAEQTRFNLEELGVHIAGEGPRDSEGNLVRGRQYPGNAYLEYLVPRDPIAQHLPQIEHAMYMRGMEVAPAVGTEVLADVVSSYFDRSYKTFCSHRQTPSSGEVERPAVVRKGRAIYFCHPIFSQYQTRAPRWCKQLFLNALALLLPEQLVRIDAPTATIAALNSQLAEERWVLHVLHYVPERRCSEFDVIEDVVPLYDVSVSIRTGRAPKHIRCVPDGTLLEWEKEGQRVRFVVPEVVGHQMIELAFDD